MSSPSVITAPQATQIPSLETEEMTELLSRVKVIYTDIDGTFLAPGGRLLKTFDGSSSTIMPETLIKLEKAGVDVVPVTGRGRLGISEMSRILGFETAISEMGGITQRGSNQELTSTFNSGDLDFDPNKYKNPFEAIEATGVSQQILEDHSGRIQRAFLSFEPREVTHIFYGNVDAAEIQAFVDSQGLPLTFLDNGRVHPKNVSLELGEDEPIHVYHLLPRGVSKGSAVALDMEHRGIDASETVSIGDSLADTTMRESAGGFVILNNALRSPRLCDVVLELEMPVARTTQNTIDGWVEFATTLLKSKGLS